MALLFTGRRHAGENLAQVLAERAEGLSPPLQICDALSRNLPKKLETIVGYCNGHEVGALFMSLIHTCELSGSNPFDYLTELQKHPTELAKNPAAWMPWNYRAPLG